MSKLFSTNADPKPARKRRSAKPTRRWRELLPIRKTTLGVPYTDPERAERLRVALVGVHMDKQAEHLMERVMQFLADDRMALRIFELRDQAPARIEGTERLSARMQHEVRGTFSRGEKRGTYYYVRLPFSVRMHKRLPKRAVLQHGVCLLGTSGFDLGLVSGAMHRSKPEEWAAIEERGAVERVGCARGCGLIVGDSDARTSWAHLSELGALAVWPTNSRHLYVLKVLPGHKFPTPFDLAKLRRRAAGGDL